MVFKRAGSDRWQVKVHRDGEVIRVGAFGPKDHPEKAARRFSEKLEHKLRRLVELRQSSEPVPPDLERYLVSLPRRIRDRLSHVHLLTPSQAAPRAVHELLAEWTAATLDRGKTAGHAAGQRAQAAKVAEAVGAERLLDLDTEAVQAWLTLQVRAGKMSSSTARHYCGSAKAFSRWAFTSGRHHEDVLARLKRPRAHKKRERGFFDLDEQARLLASALDSPHEVEGYSGEERALLYGLGLASGFRAGELFSLLVRDVDLERRVIRLRGERAKNRRGTHQPINGRWAEWLRPRVEGRPPAQPLVGLKNRSRKSVNAAATIHFDMEGARPVVPVDDEQGRYRDFHSLRVSFCCNLVRGGVSLAEAQKLMRHQSVELTAGIYTLFGASDLQAAIERAPGPPAGAAVAGEAVGA